MIPLQKIISGGQTGADQGALDGAIDCDFPYGGAIPAGRKTEVGPMSTDYVMEELATEHYPDRTVKNVADGDGTIILTHGKLTGGSALTLRVAHELSKPCLHIDFNEMDFKIAVETVKKWLIDHRIAVLNVAGQRASSNMRVYQLARNLVVSLLNSEKG